MPWLSRPAQVEVDLAEAHRVGLRLRPVHALEELAAAEQVLERLLLALAVHHHVAVLHEPGVEVHLAAERVEAVVRHDHEDGVLRDLLPQPAHEVVRPAVDLLDRVAVLRGERRVVHRVPRVDEAPHHVGDAVGRLDRGHEEVPVVALQVLEDDLLAVVHGPVGVVEELGLVEPALVEGLVRRLRPPERPVEADLLRRAPPRTRPASRSGSGGLRGSMFTGEA